MKTQNILIINTHPRLKTSPHFLRTNCSRILEWLGLKDASLEITLCDDAFMRRQNRKHMGKAGTTDVLSFPQLPPQKRVSSYRGKFLGDILISLDQAKRQADAQKLPLRKELLFLTLHAVLHLVGYDHAEEGERIKMQKLESSVWKNLMH